MEKKRKGWICTICTKCYWSECKAEIMGYILGSSVNLPSAVVEISSHMCQNFFENPEDIISTNVWKWIINLGDFEGLSVHILVVKGTL